MWVWIRRISAACVRAPEQVAGHVEVLEVGPGPGRAPAVHLHCLRGRAHGQRAAYLVACARARASAHRLRGALPAHAKLCCRSGHHACLGHADTAAWLGRACMGTCIWAAGALETSTASSRGNAPLLAHLQRSHQHCHQSTRHRGSKVERTDFEDDATENKTLGNKIRGARNGQSAREVVGRQQQRCE